jgi:hypothetical protein
MAPQVIVVGGGLSGLSTAHTILEQGGRVLLLDKSAYLGGNSTKATSGINGALTQTQIANGIKDDSRELFYEDAAKSAAEGLRAPLVKVLVRAYLHRPPSLPTHASNCAVRKVSARRGAASASVFLVSPALIGAVGCVRRRTGVRPAWSGCRNASASTSAASR